MGKFIQTILTTAWGVAVYYLPHEEFTTASGYHVATGMYLVVREDYSAMQGFSEFEATERWLSPESAIEEALNNSALNGWIVRHYMHDLSGRVSTWGVKLEDGSFENVSKQEEAN